MNRAGLWVPLAVLLLLTVLLWFGFRLAPAGELPSALIGKPMPEFTAFALDGRGPLSEADLPQQPFLLNVWATWCPTCLAEHGELMRIAREHGVPICGINYKDDAQLARQWLQTHGDPYLFSLQDADGALGINLGVYGAPETFVVDATGVIRHRRTGAVDSRVWERDLAPLLARLRGEAGGGQRPL